MPLYRGSRRLILRRNVAAAGGADAAETTAFLARADAITTVGATERAAYKALINGLVADGVFAKIDVMYVFATDTSAHALLNLTSSSFTASLLATNPTFTADQGFTGNGVGAIDTTFNLATNGTAYTLNSATAAVCLLNNRTTAGNDMAYGSAGPNFLTFRPLMGSNTYEASINDSNFITSATTTSKGNWLVNRTSSSSVSAYRNGSLLATTASAVAAVPNSNTVYVLAYAAGGITSPGSDQAAAFMLGGGFSGTDVTNYTSRLSTFMTAVGNSGV